MSAIDQRTVLYLLAVCQQQGADAALTAAIEAGAIPADWHINSGAWGAALAIAAVEPE